MIDYDEFFYARGKNLDRIGEIYAVKRKTKTFPLLFNWSLTWTEPDEKYRKRILGVLKG